MLNMFRALLCPSSGALDYTFVIAAYGVRCLAAGCRASGAGQQGLRSGRGVFHEVQNPSFWTHTLLPLCSMQIREGWVTSKTQLTLLREEKPTRYHCKLYCTYDMLNMFRAFLCPSSRALDYTCVIAAYGVQCLAAGCWGSGAGQQDVSPGRGMLHDSVSCSINC